MSTDGIAFHREMVELLDRAFTHVRTEVGSNPPRVYPDGTGKGWYKSQATRLQNILADDNQERTSADILLESVWKALSQAPNSAELVEQLIGVAATSLVWAWLVEHRHELGG